MLKEFKEFALKGNMIDMAVGIIIGVAFGTVVKSLVDDIMMPILSGVFKAPDFSNLFFVINNPTDQTFSSITAAREAGAAVIGIGLFINALIAFLLVAVALFFVVKAMNRLMRQKEAGAESPGPPPEPTTQEKLLAEIRDLLKTSAPPPTRVA